MGDTYDAIVWVEQNLNLSLKILRVITQEATPNEYLKIEGIFKIFQTLLSPSTNNHTKQEVYELKNTFGNTLFDKLMEFA